MLSMYKANKGVVVVVVVVVVVRHRVFIYSTHPVR